MHEAQVLLGAEKAKEELGIKQGELKIDPASDVKKHYHKPDTKPRYPLPPPAAHPGLHNPLGAVPNRDRLFPAMGNHNRRIGHHHRMRIHRPPPPAHMPPRPRLNLDGIFDAVIGAPNYDIYDENAA